VPEEFDHYAADYDDLLDDPIRRRFTQSQQFFAERKIDVLLALMRAVGRDAHALRWLDVGCGRGELLHLGQAAFASVAGCDVSTGMLRNASGIPVVHQTDPLRLPFEDGQFDVVTAVCVYHHVEPAVRPTLLRDTVRVLSPGGLAVIIEHNPWNPATRLIVSRTPVDQHAQLLSAPSARRLLASADLRPVATHYFLLLPPPIYRRMGWVERALASVPAGGQYAVMGIKPDARR